MYEVHWKTTDMVGGKWVAVTVPATNAFSGTPYQFSTAELAHQWARDRFKEWKQRFPYTIVSK